MVLPLTVLQRLNMQLQFHGHDTSKQQETIRQKQCKDYIRPLFKICKTHEVPEDILDSLYKIVVNCSLGEFVKANDEYIFDYLDLALDSFNDSDVETTVAFRTC